MINIPTYWQGSTVVGTSGGTDTSGNPINPVGVVGGVNYGGMPGSGGSTESKEQLEAKRRFLQSPTAQWASQASYERAYRDYLAQGGTPIAKPAGVIPQSTMEERKAEASRIDALQAQASQKQVAESRTPILTASMQRAQFDYAYNMGIPVTREEYLSTRRQADRQENLRRVAPITSGLYEKTSALSSQLQSGWEGLIGYSPQANPIVKFGAGVGSVVTGFPQFVGSGLVGFESEYRRMEKTPAWARPIGMTQDFTKSITAMGSEFVEQAKQKPVETAGMVTAMVAGPKLIKMASERMPVPKVEGLSYDETKLSGGAGRFSEYNKVPTFEPNTYSKWKTSLSSGYSTEFSKGFYKSYVWGYLGESSGEPRGLFSTEPPMEVKTTLSVIDNRNLKFTGSKGFEITPKEIKTKPLYEPTRPSDVSGGTQVLLQQPQKTVQAQVMKPVFVLSAEKVFSREKLAEIMPERSITTGIRAFPTLTPKKSLFPFLAIGVYDYSTVYPAGAAPPSTHKTTSTPILTTSFIPVAQANQELIKNIPVTVTANLESLRLRTVQTPILRNAPIQSTNQITPLRNVQILSTGLAQQTRQITQQITRQSLKPATSFGNMGLRIQEIKPKPLRLPTDLKTNLNFSRKGLTGKFGKFPERSRVASAGKVLGLKGLKFPWEEKTKKRNKKK